jgi:hypothetical protein
MSTRKLTKAIQQLVQQIHKLAQSLTRSVVNWLLRTLLMLGRTSNLSSNAGFVLPTAVLLLLVLTLTVGSIGYRAYTRSAQAIGERQQRVIYNAATPAIDRAKSKLEYLFDAQKDSRFPGGIPSESWLLGMLLNDGLALPDGTTVPKLGSNDIYTLPGEKRVAIAGNSRANAWSYDEDTNGDGQVDATVYYSIIFSTPTNFNDLKSASDKAVANRAKALQVRNGPLSNAAQGNPACQVQSQQVLPPIQQGWFQDNTKNNLLRKNFQVDVLVVPKNPNGTVTTLEFFQDRQLDQSNKWGAWFRNDLEIFPGPAFNWNGAMHSEGNLIVASGPPGPFTSYLISAPASCLYDSPQNSEISVTQRDGKPNTSQPGQPFQAQFIKGTIKDNSFTGTATGNVFFHLFNKTTPVTAAGSTGFSSTNDSITDTGGPADYALDPTALFTQDVSVGRTFSDPSVNRNTAWDATTFVKQFRMKNEEVEAPAVDDSYRADNRFGPKPRYRISKGVYVPVNLIGQKIVGDDRLTKDIPQNAQDSSSVGLDGYWERRARLEGLRIIVGTRLELGDPAGWGGPSVVPAVLASNPPEFDEPLRPWFTPVDSNNKGTPTEARQRRTLWDNLAAVQAGVVYHSASKQPDTPLACMALTVHPGTPTTLAKSSTFEDLIYSNQTPGTSSVTRLWQIPGFGISDPGALPDGAILTDFFRGRGTNGWEFGYPTTVNYDDLSSPIMQAVQNLSTFAGDPRGGTPSFTPTQGGGSVYPNPSMAMWGDFSMLRRVIDEELPGGYANLSPADKTTLHTAVCTVAMLAYNLNYLENFDISLVEAAEGSVSPTVPFLLGNPGNIFVTPPGPNPTPIPTSLFDPTSFNKSSVLTNPVLSRELNSLRGRLYQLSVAGKVVPTDPEIPPSGTAITSSTANITDVFPNPTQRANITREFRAYTQSGAGTGAANYDNPDGVIRLLEQWRDAWLAKGAPAAQIDHFNQQIYLAQLIFTKEQVARDRRVGFFGTNNTKLADLRYGRAPLGRCQLWINNADPTIDSKNNQNKSTANVIRLDPLRFLCSSRPRYPILYSLFPAELDGNNGGGLTGPGSFAGKPPIGYPPPATQAISDSPPPQYYDRNAVTTAYNAAGIYLTHQDLNTNLPGRDSEDLGNVPYIFSANSGRVYNVVQPSLVAAVAARPKPIGSWVLPAETGVSNPAGDIDTPATNRDTLIKLCKTPCLQATSGWQSTGRPTRVIGAGNATEQFIRVPFKDAALYNGREAMSVRVLDINLDLLRRKSYSGDRWLPLSGIVYAFREDAVSELEIVRPTGTLNASSSAYLTREPALTGNGISPKPVDYYPDPDRRPYGFRLKNGRTLRRDGDAGRGLSFVSDNPVYIQGSFNLHVDADPNGNGGPSGPVAGNRLEEFQGPGDYLKDDFSNFYARKNLDPKFSRTESDWWRPAEILADAVTILSDNFCDGSILDGVRTVGAGLVGMPLPIVPPTIFNNVTDAYGCVFSGNVQNVTSYLNQNRPTTGPATNNDWMRSNPADTLSIDNPPPTTTPLVAATETRYVGDSPIFFSRFSNPKINVTTSTSLPAINSYKNYSGSYAAMSTDKPKIQAVPGTRVNGIVISGLVPSRTNQSYGGLHNFVRFLEDWSGAALYFQGSFVQLSFSTHATGPFDQDAFETGTNPTSAELILYYKPPTRNWGYDVGLQYAPAGPLARRFGDVSTQRSEFYNEPPANDPYIRNLCLVAQQQTPGVGVNCPQ